MTLTTLAESKTTQQQNFFYLIPGNRNLGYYRLFNRYFPEYGYSGWSWAFNGPLAHSAPTVYNSREGALASALADAIISVTIPEARKDVCEQMRAQLGLT